MITIILQKFLQSRKQIVEELTQSLVDCYPITLEFVIMNTKQFQDNNEQLKIKHVSLNRTFIYPDKNNDINDKAIFMKHLTTKVRKIKFKTRIRENIQQGLELTTKEKKTLKTSYSVFDQNRIYDTVRETK